MYAVVKTGGKQLRVEEGATAVVERLDVPVGEKVTLPVLFVSRDGKAVFDGASLSKVTVTAEVVEHFRGEKVTVFKFKKRKGYKRTKGHRQERTRVRVLEIGMGAKPTRKAASKKVAEKPEAPVADASTSEQTEAGM